MMRLYNIILLVMVSWNIQSQDDLIKRADSLYARGNYTKAIELFKGYEKQNAVYEKTAKAYVALGNYDTALENYENALKAFPTDALIKYDYAKLLSRTKKLHDAAVLFNELVYLDYKYPNYHYELGLVLEKQGDSTAMNRFHSAFDFDPTHQKAIYKIARYYLAKRKHEASLKFINTGLETYANNVELISLKALNYYWKENYKEASVWFEKLLALGETSQFIHEKLSFCYAQQSQFEKAINHALRATEYDPKNATNLYILGQLYEQTKEFAAAEDYLSKALHIMDKPLNAEYVKLAGVLNRQQKYKEAIVALQKAVKEDPQDDSAQFALVRTKDEYYGDRNSKIKVYETFIQRFPQSLYTSYAVQRLRELRNEKFMKSD